VAAAETALPPLPHAPPTACLNCDTPLTDRFCAHCGQSAATHRLTMGHLLHEIPHSVWHVDKGIFYTLRELLLRPGPTLLGYLRGQRARHFAPLSLLLLVTGVASFLSLKLHIGEMAQTANPDAVAELRDAQTHAGESVMRYMSWLYVAVAPFIALFARRLLRRAGLNLAETLVAVLYITAAGNLISLLLMPGYYWARSGTSYIWMAFVASVTFTAYQTWAYGQLLMETSLSPLGRWWRGLLTALATYGLVICGTVVLMFALNWGDIKKGFLKQVEHQRAIRPKSAPAHQ
jgi:hypothetical protein